MKNQVEDFVRGRNFKVCYVVVDSIGSMSWNSRAGAIAQWERSNKGTTVWRVEGGVAKVVMSK